MIHSDPNLERFAVTCSARMLEHTNDLIGLLDLDNDGRYLYASMAHQRILGYTPALLVDQSGTALVHPGDLAMMRQQLASLADQDTAQATIRYRHADATWRWIEMRWH